MKHLKLIVPLALTAILATTYFARAKDTIDDIDILAETDAYVEIAHEGNVGRLYKSFSDDFSNPDFLQWFGDQKWTTMSLLSPGAKSVDAYATLRRAILNGEADFLDNRIDPTDGYARFIAVAPSANMVTSKSMLEQNLLWFVEGDDLWFSADYYLAEGIPFTIVDFQERGRHNSPGPRVTIWGSTHIGMEMKHLFKPELRQTEHPVPIGEWFNLRVHLVLDHRSGQVQIWQDDALIIEGEMRTIPAANSILNALEVGITATGEAAELWVDNVQISHNPL